MFTVYNSTSRRATSTAQDFLNDINGFWDWFSVDYDPQIINVTEIQVSNYVFITLSTDSTPKVKIINDFNETSQTISWNMSTYRIIRTDTAMIVVSGSDAVGQNQYPHFFCVSKMIDENDSEYDALIFAPSSTTSRAYIYHDDILTSEDYYDVSKFVKTSAVNTVLIPIYSTCSPVRFKDILFGWLTKPADAGKITLNDTKYYIDCYLAIPYTDNS